MPGKEAGAFVRQESVRQEAASARAMKHYLEIASALTAFLAAGLWWRSATIKTPSHLSIPIGGGTSLPQLGIALRRQARWSAAAAITAGISAAAQGIGLLF